MKEHTDRTDQSEPLPPELEGLSHRLDELAERDRAGAPEKLRAALLRAGPKSGGLGGPIPIAPWLGRPSVRIAAAMLIVGSIAALSWWATTRPNAARPENDAVAALELDEELELISASDEWLAGGATDLDDLSEEVARLDASLEDLWPAFDDPLSEDAL